MAPRQSRAARSADANERNLAAVPEPPAETPKPPDAKPTVTVTLVQVPYHRPEVTMPDGTVIVCLHRYLHETEKAAAACGRAIARAGKFVQ
jgi:hypothetical protein